MVALFDKKLVLQINLLGSKLGDINNGSIVNYIRGDLNDPDDYLIVEHEGTQYNIQTKMFRAYTVMDELEVRLNEAD